VIGSWWRLAGWSDRHRVALAAGALLTYALKDHPSRVCKSARRTSRTVALGTTGWGLPYVSVKTTDFWNQLTVTN